MTTKHNPFEDGDDAKFVVAKKHKIRHGSGSSGRSASFVGTKKRGRKKKTHRK